MSASQNEFSVCYFSMKPVRPSTTSSREVLIIEHDEAIRRLLVELVRRNGCKAFGAASLSEASMELTQRDYALVIFDTHLPGGRAMNIPRFLREHPGMALTPIVAVSSDDTPKYIEDIIDSGADQFVVKPIRREEVRQLLSLYSLLSVVES
ncbi:MAG: response regulator [Bryobacteraceae bacterium]